VTDPSDIPEPVVRRPPPEPVLDGATVDRNRLMTVLVEELARATARARERGVRSEALARYVDRRIALLRASAGAGSGDVGEEVSDDGDDPLQLRPVGD